jgi:uncharacterized membrane protein
MILAVAPGSAWWVRGAAAAILLLHIGAGGTAIGAGAVAMIARKGARAHRLAGNAFFVAMLIMSGIGAVVAPYLPTPQWSSTVAGALTFYLALSGWVTAWRTGDTAARAERWICGFGAAVGVFGLGFGVLAARGLAGVPGEAGAGFVFGGVAALGAVLDVRMLRVGGLRGAARLTRHLWRMGTALLIATASFFLGQQKVFPVAWRGSVLLFLPVIAVLAALVYWFIRVRLGGRGRLTRDPSAVT